MATPSWARAVPPRSPVTELALAQDGVVTREQLRLVGCSRDVVRAQARSGRWRTLGRRVVILGNGVLTTRQQRWVAVLHHGDGAALAAWTAAEEHGLTGYGSRLLHVVVAHQSYAERLPHVVVHESRRFDPRRDRVRVNGIPCTGRARSVLDAATWSLTVDRAVAIAAASVQQGLVRPVMLLDELAHAGAVRYNGVLRRALHDVQGGSHSLAEIDFVKLCRRAGLPVPARQVTRRGSDGRWRYLDLEWLLADGRRVRCEIDGALHRDPERHWADLRRRNALAEPGVVQLAFPAWLVRVRPEEVVTALRRHLAST